MLSPASKLRSCNAIWTLVFTGFLFLAPSHLWSQNTNDKDHTTHQHSDDASPKKLAEQLRGLQAKVAQLEAVLQQKHAATTKSDLQVGSMKNMMSMHQKGMNMSGGSSRSRSAG